MRGCAVAFPPFLTLVILLWIGQTVHYYVIAPTADLVRSVLAWTNADLRPPAPIPEAATLPLLFVGLVVLMYFVGRFVAVGIGRVVMRPFEQFFERAPLVRTVYSAVKQVTDLLLAQGRARPLRVVAVEYPEQGLWSIGFVTGDGFADVSAAANEPTLAVLMPTYPMPMVGRTIMAPLSEARDLDLTIDQACQYVMSYGMIVPPGFPPPGR